MPRVVLLVLVALVIPFRIESLFASEPPSAWSQFRGPDGQGNLGTKSLPVKWSDPEQIRWKAALPGLGHASPVHDGQTVWLATAARDGSAFGAVAIDLASGNLIHEIAVFNPRNVEAIHPDNSYASPTPVLSGGRLYLHFGTYGTACLDAVTGDILWKHEEFKIEHQGGPGSSPVLFEDLLIVTCDGANAQFLAALDADTGQVRWRRSRGAPFRSNPVTRRAFSTPLITHFEGEPQLISPGADQCHCYHPRSGEERWHVRYTGFSTVPRPVADQNTVYFCTGYFQPQLWAVNLGGTGNVSETHVRWKADRAISDTPSPTLHRGAIYFVSNDGILTCLDCETGNRRWVFRLGGNYSASPLIANGLLYACSEQGLVKVVELADKPKTVAINRFPGERIMASPAVIASDLLIRTDKNLYRIRGE